MAISLGVAHEDLLWRIRLEPGLIDVFSKIWGTDELLVSFGKHYIIPIITCRPLTCVNLIEQMAPTSPSRSRLRRSRMPALPGHTSTSPP